MDYVAPLELKFKNGSVWVKPVPVHVYNPSTGKHDSGKWLCYFSFSMPGQVFYGETLKDEYSRPRISDDSNEAIESAKIFFEYVLG